MVMARAYGDDLRTRVLDAAIAGASARSAAARFGVGIATAIVWIRRARQDGERSARRQGKPRGSRLDAQESFVYGLIEANKDVSLNEMVARLKADRALDIGRSALSAWLRGRGWTFKKSPRMHWSRSGRTL
jgi:transposase